jgi:hypothetical protein
MSVPPETIAPHIQVFHTVRTAEWQCWLWRLFRDDETGNFHLYNLAKLEAFGFERERTEYDPDLMEQYEWLFQKGLRLASAPDLEFVPDPDIDPEAFSMWMDDKIRAYKPIAVRVHCADQEDEDETRDAVVVRQDDGESARYFEECEYCTIAPGNQAKDPSEDPSTALALIVEGIDQLKDGVNETKQVGLQVLSSVSHHAEEGLLHRASDISEGSGKEMVSGKGGPVEFRKVLRDLGFRENHDQFRFNEAEKILKFLGKPGTASTICNRWCATGSVEHVKIGGKILIPRASLIDMINYGRRDENTYRTYIVKNPAKAPKKSKRN